MAREFMCQYGNCTKTETPITVSERSVVGERVRFCCWEHAGLYALRRAWQYEPFDKRAFTTGVIDKIKSELE